jgi:nucleotide-binding universal stress UspA family protein
MMTLSHIVVAIDLDEHSLPALAAGVDLAEVHKAKVTLVHILEPTPTPPGLEAFALEGMPIDWVERVTAARRGVAERKLAELTRDHSRPSVPVTPVLLSGLMPETLNEFLRRDNADLLVVASHGRKGVAHFFLGSVAERLMRTAPCPVLVVKPPATAAT